MRKIYVIAHNMRSTYNVGSLLRTAEGLGVETVFLTGYTPYPRKPNDTRLPHISQKLTDQISKTSLGAETTQVWEQYEDVELVINKLKANSIPIVALEQSPKSIELASYHAPEAVAIFLGEEVQGIPKDILTSIDTHLEIPMFGKKESFNVVQAAAMALFALRFQ